MHKMTKYTDIPRAVKEAVAYRDSIDGRCCCVVCGSPDASPCCHIIRRSRGGLGVDKNIVSLCTPCHNAFDNGIGMKRLEPLGFSNQYDIYTHIVAYIRRFYPDWTPESVTYRKEDHL